MAGKKVNISVIINAIAKDKGMKEFAKLMKDVSTTYPEGLDSFVSKVSEASKAGKSSKKNLGAVGQILNALGAKGGVAGKSMSGVAKSLGAAAPAAAGVAAAMGILVVAFKLGADVLKRWLKQTKQFSKDLKNVWQGLKNSVGALRLFSQGVLTVARSMTFFIATPIQKFLKQGAKAAIDLETALVRVAKVTGELFDNPKELQNYSKQIRNMATVSVSSAEELARFAEQLGQMGVRDKGALTELVAIMDVVAASTDIAADNIAADLGAIANAYQHSMASSGEALEKAITFVDRTAEVVNALENAAGTTASQVVEMLKDVGSTFSGLTSHINDNSKSVEMNIGQVAGWVTVAKEMGMSAEEVGTAMRNLPSYVLDNADAIDTYRISNEKFANSQQFVNGLHTDFYATMDALITSLSQEDDAIQNVAFSTDLLGRRSGRLIQNLIKAKEGVKGVSGEFIRYDDIMREAQKAWEEGGSLMTEYNKMLNTTEVRLKMLKNGFDNLSVTVGNDVLPMFNELIDIATAGALAFSDLFKSIDNGTKTTIGKIVGFAALYGPVSWFISQTVFGLTMMLNGLMRIGAFIGPLVKMFGTLIGGIMTLNPVLILAGSILFSFFNTLTGGMDVVAGNIRNFFESILSDTKSWTKAWMDTWAKGIIEGSKAVIQAVSTVAKVVASFLEAHSPPEQGPLSSIDMWGAVLMNTWLKGFAKADFGILSDVASTVEGILSSIHFTPSGEDDDQERKKVVKGLIGFREQFSKLLKLNRKGIKITDEYLDNLVKGYGSSADEVKKLIKAHLDLERVQRRLAEIEQERVDINDTYADRVEAIRLSGKSAEEMVESIASAAYERDQNLGALSEEEKLLKKREEMFQLQLETQQELMKALQEQSDLWKELLALQSGGGGGGTNIDDLVSGFGSFEDSLSGLMSKADEAQLRFIQLRIQAEKFKEMLFTIIETFKAFWSVVTGQMTLDEAFDPKRIQANVEAALDPDAAKSIINDYINVFKDELTNEDGLDLTGFVENLPEDLRYAFDNPEIRSAFDEGLSNLFDGEVPPEVDQAFNGMISDLYTDIRPEDGVYAVLGDAAVWKAASENIVDAVKGPFGTLADLFSGDLLDNVKDFFIAFAQGMSGESLESGGGMEGMWSKLAGPEDESDGNSFLNIAHGIGVLADALLTSGPIIFENIGKIAENLATFLVGEDMSGAGPLESVIGIFESLEEWSGKLETFSSNIDNLKNTLKTAVAVFLTVLIAPISAAIAVVAGLPVSIGLAFGLLATIIATHWKEIKGFFQKIIDWFSIDFSSWWTELWEGFPEAMANLPTWLKEKGQAAVVALFKGLFSVVQKGIDWYNEKIADKIPTLGRININLREQFSAAGGQSVPQGMLGTVGESGRELFSTPVAGKITSHSLTEKMIRDVGGSSAGGQVININIDSPVVRSDEDIDALVNTLMYRIAEMV